MKKFLYPTPDQVSLTVRWHRDGPRALDPDNGTRHGELKNRARTNNLLRVRDLIFRLSLPFQYETMRAEILHRRMSSVDSRLLPQLVSTLRMYGYIHPSPDGHWSATPLTAYQLHLVRGLASGSSTTDMAVFFGQDVSCVNAVLRRARADHGLATTPHLIGHAYASGWLPTFAEHAGLMRFGPAPEGKPYRIVSGAVRAA